MDTILSFLDTWMILPVGIILVVWALAAFWLLRWRRSVPGQIRRLIRSISVDALVNVNIPDGMNGEIHIDYLLLTPRGLLLFDVNDAGGAVFAGNRLDVWTAVEPGHRFTFDNPLPALRDRAAAVAWLAPGLPIDSRVVFPRATFPKGHPDAVTTLEALRGSYPPVLRHRGALNADDITLRWDRIKASVSTTT